MVDEVITQEENPNEVLTSEPTEGQNTDSPADDKTAVEGAPEQYEFDLGDMEKDEALLSEFEPVARELNLSQEKAQKLVDLYNKSAQAKREVEVKAWDDMQKDWVNEVKSDPEVGGHDFMEKLAVAKRAVDQYGSPELKKLFNFTGVGNNVAMVKFLYNVGKTLADDKVISGRGQDQPRDVAKLLFPNMS